jgi:hypothetical protein
VPATDSGKELVDVVLRYSGDVPPELMMPHLVKPSRATVLITLQPLSEADAAAIDDAANADGGADTLLMRIITTTSNVEAVQELLESAAGMLDGVTERNDDTDQDRHEEVR